MKQSFPQLFYTLAGKDKLYGVRRDNVLVHHPSYPSYPVYPVIFEFHHRLVHHRTGSRIENSESGLTH